MSARLQRQPRLDPEEAAKPLSGPSNQVRLPRNKTENTPPPVEADLISYLETVYMPKVDPHFTLRDYDRQVGHWEVIEHLKMHYIEQTKQERE